MLKTLKYIAALVLIALVGAIAWWWTPDIPHAELAAKYANDASRFVTLPSGARAHYRDQGNVDGKPFVLLHGSNASLHTWEPWVRELGDTYRLITVDLPGHGLTGPVPGNDYTYAGMVSFVKEFTEAIGLTEFSLGGNSMGGGVTLGYALLHPDDLTAIVLVDAAGVRAPSEVGGKIDRPLAFDLAGRWYTDWILENITPRSFAAEGLQKSVSVKSIITEEMIDRYWELVRHPGNREATGIRFASYRKTAGRDLAIENIQTPTLILWGEDDSLIPVESGIKMDRLMQNSKIITFKGVGHLPMEEAPKKTATLVHEFLSQY